MFKKGILGGIFDNDTVLWFIILFLLLFWNCECVLGSFKRTDSSVT